MRNTIFTLMLLSYALIAQAVDHRQVGSMAQDDQRAAFKKTSAPKLASAIAMIYDEQTQRPLFSKNSNEVVPIASITKLMTAMVVLDARLPLDEQITISSLDRDRFKGTRSRMRNGMTLSRGELLKLALMASENVAAAALARTYPGGTQVMLSMMNAKARELGMASTRFDDPTGLHSTNVSTAHDLVKMVSAASEYEEIERFSTTSSHTVQVSGRRSLRFNNTNPLVRNSSWDIGVSKTGYISEAGKCLVMQAKISNRPVVIVLLDSWGRHTRVGDANRIKRWMEGTPEPVRKVRRRIRRG
ncbi:MAG: D-alanyl-D-alanine endopeptidase [Sideroxydans sp.]|jgi:D-alanyl-D-alanine endopeptidase (penicillin-binding protein 7)